MLKGPVSFEYILPRDAIFRRRHRSLQLAEALLRSGRIPRELAWPLRAQSKWAMLLRTADGVLAGESQQKIAVAIYGREVVERDWRPNSDYLRLRIKRAVRAAEDMLSGGHVRLLRRGSS